MKLRRKILNDLKGQPKQQRALAIALLVKSRLDRTQTIKDYNISKISHITGISCTTIRKYMPVLKRMRLIAFFGKNNQHITFKALHSHTNNRNINVEQFKFDNLQSVLRSIQAYIAIFIQVRKEHIKRTIQISKDPQKGQDFKSARKEVKRLVKCGILHDVNGDYKEYGISYNRFAKELGTCVKTAFEVISFAIQNGWLRKQRHVQQIFSPKVNYRNVEGFTFATKNNLYVVKANTYEVDANTSRCISCAGNIRL